MGFCLYHAVITWLQVHFAQHTCFKRLLAAILGCRVMAGAGQLLDIWSELLFRGFPSAATALIFTNLAKLSVREQDANHVDQSVTGNPEAKKTCDGHILSM